MSGQTGLYARLTGAVLGVALLLAGPASAPAQEQDVILRLHHFLPAQSVAQARFLEPWARRIEADSGGRIRIDIFPAMQLGGKPAQLYDQARDGVVDLVWTLPSYTPGRFPVVALFELPFLPASAAATSQALSAFAERHLAEEFAGVRPLLLHVHAPGAIHMAGRPVRGLADLAGATIRVATPALRDTFAALGAVPVGMPVSEVPQALARGVVDGAALPFEVAVPLRIHEAARFHTRIAGARGLYTAVFLLAMNRQRYESLPDALKAVLDRNSGASIAGRVGAVWDDAERRALATVRARGNSMIALDGAAVARWRARTRPVIDRWVADMTGRGLDGRALLEEARRLISAYGAGTAPPSAR